VTNYCVKSVANIKFSLQNSLEPRQLTNRIKTLVSHYALLAPTAAVNNNQYCSCENANNV